MPIAVSNSLYNRAKNLLQSTAIPTNLLNDCTPRLPPKSMTFGDSVRYNEHLLNVIEMCNRDKRAIRLINQ
ncbi:Rz1-like lysis system protein LysC [Gilliamella apicola]|uniref:Rz1-like lysis system protein LysC n=1 Tax=Gilliamella apicola TaxID=1196095 RepID=UPI000A32F056